MSSVSPDVVSRKTNPLFLPLVVVASFAMAAVVAVVVLLGVVLVMFARPGPSPAPPRAVAAPPAGRPVVAELPHGKRGQRVESAGFAITVEKIVYKPVSDPLSQVGPERRYLALLVLVENNTGSNVSFYPTSFRLQDSQSYEYQPLAMKLTGPALEWRNLGNRETMRGYVDFTVPRSSKGLTLVYTHLAQPIRIDLDE